MLLLGLHYAIWIVIVLYFIGMLALGWWSKKGIVDREGFLLGNRQFGVAYMVMHAFGAGTHPGDVAGVTSKTVESGASVELPRDRRFAIPAFDGPPGGLHVRAADLPSTEIETRIAHKLRAVETFAEANPIDRRIHDVDDAVFGFVTTGT